MPVFEQKSGPRRAVRAPRGCNGVLVMLQRGARCKAIAAPLQSNKAAAGSHSLPSLKDRVCDVIVSGYVTAICKNGDFSVKKRPRFLPSQDLKIWERGGDFLKSIAGFCGKIQKKEDKK